MADVFWAGRAVGFAMTGSFCTFERAFAQMEALARGGARLFPIFSENAFTTDTRFGLAADHVARAARICGRPPLHTISETEPIGPKKLLEILIVAPCTGNTLGKIAGGVTDTPVTMAVKAQLRNGRPVLLAPSTNDGLTGSASALARLFVMRNVFFVPFGQDDPVGKPASLVARFELLSEAGEAALTGEQMQPMLRA